MLWFDLTEACTAQTTTCEVIILSVTPPMKLIYDMAESQTLMAASQTLMAASQTLMAASQKLLYLKNNK